MFSICIYLKTYPQVYQYADTRQYYYVVSAHGNSTASRVVGLLKNPPTTEKCTALKAHLLKTFELLDAERASRLFSLQGLGDSNPSELMDRMLDLLGEHRPNFLFVQLSLHQLPSQVRAALANTTITDCWRNVSGRVREIVWLVCACLRARRS